MKNLPLSSNTYFYWFEWEQTVHCRVDRAFLEPVSVDLIAQAWKHLWGDQVLNSRGDRDHQLSDLTIQKNAQYVRGGKFKKKKKRNSQDILVKLPSIILTIACIILLCSLMTSSIISTTGSSAPSANLWTTQSCVWCG